VENSSRITPRIADCPIASAGTCAMTAPSADAGAHTTAMPPHTDTAVPTDAAPKVAAFVLRDVYYVPQDDARAVRGDVVISMQGSVQALLAAPAAAPAGAAFQEVAGHGHLLVVPALRNSWLALSAVKVEERLREIAGRALASGVAEIVVSGPTVPADVVDRVAAATAVRVRAESARPADVLTVREALATGAAPLGADAGTPICDAD